MGDKDRLEAQAAGALRKIAAMKQWLYGGPGTTAKQTLNGVQQVILNQRNELLALHAYIDSLEKPE